MANVPPVRGHDCGFHGFAGDVAKGTLVMDRYNWMHGWYKCSKKPVAKWLYYQ